MPGNPAYAVVTCVCVLDCFSVTACRAAAEKEAREAAARQAAEEKAAARRLKQVGLDTVTHASTLLSCRPFMEF
jgi:hypothetical protein